MKPAIHDGLVLYAPIEHPERMAAGMSAANSDGKKPKRDYDPLKRPRPSLGDVLGVLVIFGLCFGLWCVTP